MSRLTRSRALRFALLGLLFAAGARAATLTGEVIDTYCYAHVGIRGPAHAACGLKCAKAGVPVGLLENGTRKIYVLLADRDATPLPPQLVAQMGREVVVEGDVVAKGGSLFFKVRSFRSSQSGATARSR
jgi:hypothetical protein